MNCPHCGRENRTSSSYCAGCGTRLETIPVGPSCPTCQQNNRPSAKHCRACGAPLLPIRRCAHCGAENRASARYCRNCSQPLMANAPPRLGTGSLAGGMVLNQRYAVAQKIAQGGMGAVYFVLDTRLNKHWAMKEMSQRALAPVDLQDAIQRFQNEARILATLRHVNLPQVIDLFAFEGKQFLVMDYIAGKTLEEILKQNRGALPLEQVMNYARQLVAVLGFLHRQTPPIIYLDLKPSNVMVEQTGQIKLIDFGISRFLKKRTSKNLLQEGLSENDAGIGTPGYAAPEQWKAGNITPQSDVYSLGVTLHQLLTTHDPTEKPFFLPPIQSLNPAVPEPICAALAPTYEWELAKRYKSIGEFERALEQAWR